MIDGAIKTPQPADYQTLLIYPILSFWQLGFAPSSFGPQELSFLPVSITRVYGWLCQPCPEKL